MLEKLQMSTLRLVNDLTSRLDERGATAVEYALIVSFIAAAVAAGAAALGATLVPIFGDIAPAFTGP